MSAGNVQVLAGGNFAVPGTRRYQVASGAVSSIKFGEPVKINSSNRNFVVLMADADPVIGTTADTAGIAATTSTDTVAAAGIVDVFKPEPGVVYIANAKTPSLVDTQAKYDALVGKRVVFDLTSTVFTVDTAEADGANNGIFITQLDISRYPGKVAFQLRIAASQM
jgi:hypothetical protein